MVIPSNWENGNIGQFLVLFRLSIHLNVWNLVGLRYVRGKWPKIKNHKKKFPYDLFAMALSGFEAEEGQKAPTVQVELQFEDEKQL